MYKILPFTPLLTKLNKQLEQDVIDTAKKFNPKSMGKFSISDCKGYGWNDNSTASRAATQLIQLWNDYCTMNYLPKVAATDNLKAKVIEDIKRMAKKSKSEHKLYASLIEFYGFQAKLCPGGHKATQELSDHLSPGNTNYYQKVFIDLLKQTEAVISIERLESSTLTKINH